MKYGLAMALGALLLLTAGCKDYPRAMAGTTDHVRQTHTVRAGIVEGADTDRAREMAGRVVSRVKAGIKVTEGPAAILLREFEKGELDIVLGAFAKKSPWRKRVVLARPPGADKPPKDQPVLRPALRKGENRWYLIVEEAMHGGAA